MGDLVSTSVPGSPRIEIEAEATPLVSALAADLRSGLESGELGALTEGVQGTISISDEHTPQAATVTISDGRVVIAHGADADSDLVATVALPLGSGPPGEFDPGDETPAELARWLEAALTPPLPQWPDAAEAFWSALAAMPGAPPALLVIDDAGERRRFGLPDGDAYEIHGAPEALVRVLTGRLPLLDAAHGGEVAIRGTFPTISVLTGAGFRVRYGSFGG